MSLQKDYKEYCDKFNTVWKYLQSCSKDVDTIVEEVCSHRLYFDSFDKWKRIFSETGIAYVSSSTCDYSKLQGRNFEDLALFSDTEDGKKYFILNERYILPVRDMLGNVIALIGWYPDTKKYITTPSKYFSKDCLFFGMEQIGKTGLGKDYFVVEGIFDSLSLRALGYNAIAMMGIDSSRVKMAMYGLFRKLVAIPDNDKQGRKVLKGDLWKVPRNGCYLRWTGSFEDAEGDMISIKDIDQLCRMYEDDSIKHMLDECIKHKNRVIKVEI